MAIYVNTNVGGIRGRNQLNNVGKQLDTTYQRLSSGLRINSAKDDAAGLAISDRMTSQINGLTQGNRNAADAIALMQTMEGAIDEISNSVQQIRTLAVQANNGTNTQEDRQALAGQVAQLFAGIDDIAKNTKFGGKTILNGYDGTDATTAAASIFSGAGAGANGGAADSTGGSITFQIGANGGDTLSLTIASFAAADDDVSTTDDIMGKLNVAFQTACLTKGGSATADGKVTSSATVAALATAFNTDSDAITAADANKAFIQACDTAIQEIDKQRATLGSMQNRLDSTVRNQSNVIANQSDARSRIRDTDFAEESAKLSQYNIIQQASQSMLMQANARPQMALSLLG